jgi:hypothetical protein
MVDCFFSPWEEAVEKSAKKISVAALLFLVVALEIRRTTPATN